MSFAKRKENQQEKYPKNRLANLLDSFLDNNASKRLSFHKSLNSKQALSNLSHSIEKPSVTKTNKKNNYFSVSLTESKGKKKNTSGHVQGNGSSGNQRASLTENDEFQYLDQIKKKIEKSLVNNDNNEQLESMWSKKSNDDDKSLDESPLPRGSSNELLHQLQLKEAVHRQEISKLKTINEKLSKRLIELEDFVANIKVSKEKENKAFDVLQRELSSEKQKAQQLEAKLKKINPIKSNK